MLAICLCLSTTSFGGTLGIHEDLEEAFQFSLAPSCLASTSNGEWIIGLDQTERPLQRMVRLQKKGSVVSFPYSDANASVEATLLAVDSVESIKIGGDNIAWILDNGRRSESAPRLIGWELGKERLQRLLYVTSPALSNTSFCSTLALDPNEPFAYIADPASNADSALIVMNLQTGLCKRVLADHPAVKADPNVEINPIASSLRESTRIDGSSTLPHTGVRALAIDRKGEWLYFSPLKSHLLYRIKTSALKNFNSPAVTLQQNLETYSNIPPTSSLAIDSKGNLYVGDINARGIGMVDTKNRSYRLLAADVRLAWPDNLAFGSDGRLYLTSARRVTSSSDNTPTPRLSHSLFRFRTPGSGRAGD